VTLPDCSDQPLPIRIRMYRGTDRMTLFHCRRESCRRTKQLAALECFDGGKNGPA